MAWQCKRYAKLTSAKVREFVSDCSYLADEYYLVYSGEASSSVRAEIAKYPHWALVDRRGLERVVNCLRHCRMPGFMDRGNGGFDSRGL